MSANEMYKFFLGYDHVNRINITINVEFYLLVYSSSSPYGLTVLASPILRLQLSRLTGKVFYPTTPNTLQHFETKNMFLHTKKLFIRSK